MATVMKAKHTKAIVLVFEFRLKDIFIAEPYICGCFDQFYMPHSETDWPMSNEDSVLYLWNVFAFWYYVAGISVTRDCHSSTLLAALISGKVTNILHMIYPNAFTWYTIYVFWYKFYGRLSPWDPISNNSSANRIMSMGWPRTDNMPLPEPMFPMLYDTIRRYQATMS